jgi:hypothetical protein
MHANRGAEIEGDFLLAPRRIRRLKFLEALLDLTVSFAQQSNGVHEGNLAP